MKWSIQSLTDLSNSLGWKYGITLNIYIYIYTYIGREWERERVGFKPQAWGTTKDAQAIP